MKRTIGRIALLLIIGLMLGIVAGCAGTATGTPALTTPATTPEASTLNLNPPGQLPVCKDQEILRVINTQSPHVMTYSYSENKLTKYLQDRTNVAIELILYPEEGAIEKLNIELSTKGNLGDLILIPMDRAMLVTYGGQGVLAPLNDLIEQRGYLIKELMETDPSSYAKITAPDGNIYALPRGGWTGIVPNAYAMRQWIHKG